MLSLYCSGGLGLSKHVIPKKKYVVQIHIKNEYFVKVHRITIHVQFWVNQICIFGEKLFIHFPIGSYVKTLSCVGSHLGFLSNKNTDVLDEHIRNIATKE